jgi:hypothetical protein
LHFACTAASRCEQQNQTARDKNFVLISELHLKSLSFHSAQAVVARTTIFRGANRIHCCFDAFQHCSNRADDAQPVSRAAHGRVANSRHSGFADGKERKFAYSVEEIAESDYLYL